MAGSLLKTLILCVAVLLFGSCLASRQSYSQTSYEEGECNLQNLNPIDPKERIEHEGGYTDVWDENDPQLRCIGGAASLHVLRKKSLFIPSFNNAPGLIFVLRGYGVLGVVFSGCAETFQSFQQSAQGGQGQGKEQGQGQGFSFRDQHQKIHPLNQGDVVALDTGVAHWAYNEASEELVLLVIHDISNRQNQLDQNLRRFFFGGNQPQSQQAQRGQQQGQEQKPFGFNFFQALDAETIGEAFGVRKQVIEKLKNPEQPRGFIITVREGLKFASPFFEEQRRSQSEDAVNGLEETICSVRIKENLFNPERADIYTAQGGSISSLNGYNLRILDKVQLSAGRGRLQPNAMVAPYWNMNAHSISYITKGSGYAQIAGQSSEPLFDGELHQGQLFIVPQNHVHFKKAGKEGLEWVTLKTNSNAKTSPVLGKTSVFRGVPLDVWINVYKIKREEALALKYNRDEVSVLRPYFRPESEGQQGQQGQQGGGSAWSIL